MKRVALIPARLKSTRLIEKPLQLIEGKSLIAHTLSNLESCGFNEIIVLTDSEKIQSHVHGLGFKALLSPPECTSGMERMSAMRKVVQDFDVIAHIQCDEPNIKASSIEALCTLGSEPVSTLACPITEEEALEPSNVKVVFDSRGRALYFSRSPIPYHRDQEAVNYYKHIGVYAYRPKFLDQYVKLEKGPLEKAEMLEQLTLLENNIAIKVTLIDESPFGIDTPQDIEEFQSWLKKQNTSSSQAASSPL